MCHEGRVDTEDKCSLKELVRRKGLPPGGGVLNTPPPNLEGYNEGKAIYVNDMPSEGKAIYVNALVPANGSH